MHLNILSQLIPSFSAEVVARRLSLLCAILASCSTACAQTLHTDAAVDRDAKFLSFETENNWLFELAAQPKPVTKSVVNSSLVRWGSWPGVRNSQAVWLSDGSWLCGEVLIAADESIVVDNDWLQCPPIPIREARGLVLSPPASLSKWIQLQSEMLAVDGEQDELWLEDDRKLSGVIRWNSAQASLGGDRLQVDTGGQSIELPLIEVSAIVFSPALMGRLPERYDGLQVGLADGTLIHAMRVLPSSAVVSVTSAGGVKMLSHDVPEDFAAAVVYLAGGSKPATLLSRQEPASYRHVPDSLLPWDLGRNRDVYGGPLSTTAGLYFNGLAMHSASQVAFRWDGSAARLLSEAVFALPRPQADRRLGSVKCQVLLARSGKLEVAHEFSLSRNSAGEKFSSELIELDITGAKLVVLVVQPAEFGQYGDHILWLDARIAPAK